MIVISMTNLKCGVLLSKISNDDIPLEVTLKKISLFDLINVETTL